MAQLLEIKSRIKSIKSTLKITKAMKMIATARLVKARDRLNKVKPVYDRLENMTQRLLRIKSPRHARYFLENESDKVLFVAFTTDRGFCGGYNLRLFNYIEEKKQEFIGREIHILPIGQKAKDYYDKYEHLIRIDKAEDIEFAVDLFNQSRELMYDLKRLFLTGEYSHVYLIFNNFKSLLSQQPVMKALFPIEREALLSDEEEKPIDYLFEPNRYEIFERLLESYLILNVQVAFIELETGEYGSRMSAMDGANRNGEKLNRKLKIQYQRARQEAITKEITEIIGGAETLRREKDE